MRGFLKLLIKLGELRFGAIDTAQGRVENTHLAGGVPEWPKGTDCKSVGTAFGGSNPPPSTIIVERLERLLPKGRMRVSYNGYYLSLPS